MLERNKTKKNDLITAISLLFNSYQMRDNKANDAMKFKLLQTGSDVQVPSGPSLPFLSFPVSTILEHKLLKCRSFE